MRVTILSLLIFFSLAIVSCDKEDCEKKRCEIDECYLCHDKRFDDKDDVKDYYLDEDGHKINCKIDKHILSPIVKDDACGYIVSGKIKYVIDGETAAIIDYGDGEVDAWAVKTIYYKKEYDKDKGYDKDYDKYDRKKHHKTIKCCKFKQKCADSPTTATSAEVRSTEAVQ